MSHFATFAAVFLVAVFSADAALAGPVAAIFAAIQTFAASSAIAAFVVRIGFSLVLSALSRALAPKPGRQRQPGIKTETTTSGGTNPQTFVLGTYASAGNMVAPPYSHPNSGGVPNEYLTYVVDVSDLPGVSFSRVMVAGEYITDLEATTEGDHALQGMIQDNKAHLFLTWHDGTQAAADAYMMANYADHPDRPWGADMVGTGVAYAVVTFRYNRKLFNQLPGVRFEVVGVPLYDPRKDGTVGGTGAHRWNDPSTWEQTSNPAVMIYNILRGITLPDGRRWGGQVAADDLPLDNWFAAMNECDVAVPLEGGGTEPQYSAGLEVGVNDQPAAVIEELMKACSAEISEFGGVYKLRVGPPALPVYFFTDEDVVADKPQSLAPYPGLDGVHNAIHATHPSPDALWETRDAPPRYNAEWEAEDGGRQLVANVDLPAVASDTQVQRLMRAWIEDERRFRRHSLTLPPEAALLEPLDSVAWTSDREGYTGKVFEVGEISDDLATMLQSLAIREREAADFTWVPGDAVPVDHPSTVVTVPAARVLQGFGLQSHTLVDAAANARRPGLRLVWDAAQLATAEAVEYRVQLANGTPVITGLVSDPSEGEVLVSAGILPDTVYRASARVIARQGGAWTAWASVATEDLRLGGSDLDDTVRGQLATADQVRADHDALVGAFTGTLDALEVDYQAAQQAAQNSEASRLASEAARDAAVVARDQAQTAETNAGNSATAAAGSASQADTSATDAGASASAAQGDAVLASTAAAEAARTAALAGPAILAAPAEQWTNSSTASYSGILKPAVAPANFVTDDPDFGAAYEFPSAGSHILGHAYPFAWSDTTVLELRVRFRVMDDGTMGALDIRLGGTVHLGAAVLESNRQSGVIPATVADGVVEAVAWYTRRAAVLMPAIPAGVQLVSHTAAANGGDKFYPHLRQNAGNNSDGLVRVGTFEVRDITAQVDAMLAEDAALGSAQAASTSAASAAASETAAGTSASAAETARQQAQTAQGAAESARDAAATSETNAAGSASAAASSATNAANSATAAGNSASAASTSASAASTSATDAGQHATAASGHADTASIQAGNAATSATSAATSATSASDSAAAAATSATLAAGVLSEINLSATDYQRVITGTASLDGVGSAETASDGGGAFGLAGTVISATGSGSTITTSGATTGLQIEIPAEQAGTFGGRRVRVDILARAAGASPAAGFTVAYSTADNANSGRNDFVHGSGWAWHSFYYDVPVPSKGGTDWVGLWGDSAQTGKQTEFARVVIRAASDAADIPELGVVQADVSVIQGAVADLEGNAAASYVARVSAGGASAGLEMVAADDPVNGPTSSILFDADNVLIPGTTRARHLVIDENLDIDAATGAFRMGKTSATDLVNDGIFLGRTNEGGGVTGFGFNAGRTANGVQQYIRHTKADGLIIKNADFLIGAGSGTEGTTTTSQTITLPAGTQTINLEMVGGGGGGGGGTSPYSVNSANPGSAGGQTKVVLKDGSTTIQTWTAAGGAGGAGAYAWGNTGEAGQVSPMSPQGNGGKGGNATNERGDRGKHGQGGRAGDFITVGGYDISGLSNPKLVITIGGGGAGGPGSYRGGTAGTVGKVKYAHFANADIPAAPVSLTPSAVGTFTVTAGQSGTFPVLAPTRGLWVLSDLPAGFRPGIGSGTRLVVGSTATFISPQTPTWNGDHTQTKTVAYQFYPM